jgi:predicted amidophosphoribosyltransferase
MWMVEKMNCRICGKEIGKFELVCEECASRQTQEEEEYDNELMEDDE